MKNKIEVLPFGGWLIKQSHARKINRGREWELAHYISGDPDLDRLGVREMDVVAFADYITGWTSLNGDFAVALQEYNKYILQKVYEKQVQLYDWPVEKQPGLSS